MGYVTTLHPEKNPLLVNGSSTVARYMETIHQWALNSLSLQLFVINSYLTARADPTAV